MYSSLPIPPAVYPPASSEPAFAPAQPMQFAAAGGYPPVGQPVLDGGQDLSNFSVPIQNLVPPPLVEADALLPTPAPPPAAATLQPPPVDFRNIVGNSINLSDPVQIQQQIQLLQMQIQQNLQKHQQQQQQWGGYQPENNFTHPQPPPVEEEQLLSQFQPQQAPPWSGQINAPHYQPSGRDYPPPRYSHSSSHHLRTSRSGLAYSYEDLQLRPAEMAGYRAAGILPVSVLPISRRALGDALDRVSLVKKEEPPAVLEQPPVQEGEVPAATSSSGTTSDTAPVTQQLNGEEIVLDEVDINEASTEKGEGQPVVDKPAETAVTGMEVDEKTSPTHVSNDTRGADAAAVPVLAEGDYVTAQPVVPQGEPPVETEKQEGTAEEKSSTDTSAVNAAEPEALKTEAAAVEKGETGEQSVPAEDMIMEPHVLLGVEERFKKGGNGEQPIGSLGRFFNFLGGRRDDDIDCDAEFTATRELVEETGQLVGNFQESIYCRLRWPKDRRVFWHMEGKYALFPLLLTAEDPLLSTFLSLPEKYAKIKPEEKLEMKDCAMEALHWVPLTLLVYALSKYEERVGMRGASFRSPVHVVINTAGQDIKLFDLVPCVLSSKCEEMKNFLRTLSSVTDLKEVPPFKSESTPPPLADPPVAESPWDGPGGRRYGGDRGRDRYGRDDGDRYRDRDRYRHGRDRDYDSGDRYGRDRERQAPVEDGRPPRGESSRGNEADSMPTDDRSRERGSTDSESRKRNRDQANEGNASPRQGTPSKKRKNRGERRAAQEESRNQGKGKGKNKNKSKNKNKNKKRKNR